MKKILKFIYVFLIIGLQSIGNMSVVTVILEKQLVKKNKYVTEEDILDAITFSRLGPGATTANMVAFLGNKIAGFLGGVIATICYTIAPLIIIMLIAGFMDKLIEYDIIMSALDGCLVYICVMFIKSTIDMGKKVLVNKFNIVVFLIALVSACFFKVSCVWIMIATCLLVLNTLLFAYKLKKTKEAVVIWKEQCQLKKKLEEQKKSIIGEMVKIYMDIGKMKKERNP